MIKWCSMHILNLGIDLWALGSAFKVLLTYPLWGEGSDDSRLHTAWQDFKCWCRLRKFECFGLKLEHALDAF